MIYLVQALLNNDDFIYYLKLPFGKRFYHRYLMVISIKLSTSRLNTISIIGRFGAKPTENHYYSLEDIIKFLNYIYVKQKRFGFSRYPRHKLGVNSREVVNHLMYGGNVL